MALIIAAPTGASLAGEQGITVSAIRARLYYQHSGSFSEDVTTGKVALRNTIIGEGDAREPSSSALVEVELTGPPGKFDPAWRVELTASEANSSRVVLRQEERVGVLSTSGTYYCGFWLRSIGCERLLLVAKIQGSSIEKSASIPFTCGE